MDFIKNKIIKRTILSTIAPLTIFGIVVGLSRVCDFTFNQNYGWIAAIFMTKKS